MRCNYFAFKLKPIKINTASAKKIENVEGRDAKLIDIHPFALTFAW